VATITSQEETLSARPADVEPPSGYDGHCQALPFSETRGLEDISCQAIADCGRPVERKVCDLRQHPSLSSRGLKPSEAEILAASSLGESAWKTPVTITQDARIAGKFDAEVRDLVVKLEAGRKSVE
jgi:hypothetical protein